MLKKKFKNYFSSFFQYMPFSNCRIGLTLVVLLRENDWGIIKESEKVSKYVICAKMSANTFSCLF